MLFIISEGICLLYCAEVAVFLPAATLLSSFHASLIVLSSQGWVLDCWLLLDIRVCPSISFYCHNINNGAIRLKDLTSSLCYSNFLPIWVGPPSFIPWIGSTRCMGSLQCHPGGRLIYDGWNLVSVGNPYTKYCQYLYCFNINSFILWYN